MPAKTGVARLALATRLPDERISVISGPNLAREIAAHQPTATVVASRSEATAVHVARACATSYFRPYTNTDVVGVELSGAVKNVIAVAVGIAQGSGYGHNTVATVITRGLVEITRLGIALGADAETFSGLAGMGDLVATCVSPLSRNHTLGVHMGQGRTLEEAIRATGGTAEGVKSSTSVLELAGTVGVEMPITAAVVQEVPDGARDRLARVSAQARERPLQVAPQVLDVLDAHREPQQVLGDRRGLRCEPAPSFQHALHPAKAGGRHPEADGVDHRVRRGPPALRPQADDRAEAAEQARCPLVTGVGRQPWVAHLGHRGVLGQPGGEHAGVSLGPFDAERQGAQPAQGQPDLPGPGDRSVRRPVGGQPGPG